MTNIGQPSVLIIVNGAFNEYSFYPPLIQECDYIISVDGGTNHAFRLGILPDLIVGDLDSITPEILDHYRKLGCAFQTFPAEKDQSDLQLALEQAASLEPSVVTIIGALGKRFDHAFGNVGLLAKASDMGLPVRMVDETHTIQVFTRELAITGAPGDILSLFSLTPEATGVTTTALKYPLRGETLYFGDTRGLSNELLVSEAKVTVATGKLLAIHVKK